jgi:hypothetical protein
MHPESLGNRERQQGQRADRAGKLNLPDGQVSPALVVPDVDGTAGGDE